MLAVAGNFFCARWTIEQGTSKLLDSGSETHNSPSVSSGIEAIPTHFEVFTYADERRRKEKVMAGRSLVIAFGVAMFWADTRLDADVQDDINKELLATVQLLDEAFVARDAKTIRKFAAPNHISIASRYQFFNLDDQLKTLSKLKLSSNKSGPKKVIWISADVALVTYEAKLVGTYVGKRIDSRVRILTTWVRRDGKWIEISYQETALNESST